MTIRQKLEKTEEITLSSMASLSKDSKGRIIDEKECDLRPVYQRDRDRIIHSKTFRRLKHKTQVFISPHQDHYRTRLTHTLEVGQIARSIAKYLQLNEDLTEAIAMGHDLGHTPFGHVGERVLNELTKNGFSHNKHSVRVVRFLEERSSAFGLNLTREVLDGIENHSGNQIPYTNEGKVVKLADRIAYINHDIDDAIRANILKEEDLPQDIIKEIGMTHSKRIDALIRDIVQSSLEKNEVTMSTFMYDQMMELRDFMFEYVYNSDQVLEEMPKIENIIKSLYAYYMEDLNRIPEENSHASRLIDSSDEEIVTDYIASMTDRFAIQTWKEIYEPRGWM